MGSFLTISETEELYEWCRMTVQADRIADMRGQIRLFHKHKNVDDDSNNDNNDEDPYEHTYSTS